MSSVDSHRNQNDKTAVFLVNTEPQRSVTSTTSELAVSLHALPAGRMIRGHVVSTFMRHISNSEPVCRFLFLLLIVREDTSDVPKNATFESMGQ